MTLVQSTGTVICLSCFKFELYTVVEEFRYTKVITLFQKESKVETYCQTCNLIWNIWKDDKPLLIYNRQSLCCAYLKIVSIILLYAVFQIEFRI